MLGAVRNLWILLDDHLDVILVAPRFREAHDLAHEVDRREWPDSSHDAGIHRSGVWHGKATIHHRDLREQLDFPGAAACGWHADLGYEASTRRRYSQSNRHTRKLPRS